VTARRLGPVITHTEWHAARPAAKLADALDVTAASGPAVSPEQAVRALRADGRLAEAVELVDQLGPDGVADGAVATVSLGAAVLEGYGDQLAAADPDAANAACRRAAEEQRSFAGPRPLAARARPGWPPPTALTPIRRA
jgi:hypothetical protein